MTRRYDLATLLVEAGEGVLRSLFAEGLVNQSWVFVGGAADRRDKAEVAAREFINRLSGGRAAMHPLWHTNRRGDFILHYDHDVSVATHEE